jgi:hypothetical protein
MSEFILSHHIYHIIKYYEILWLRKQIYEVSIDNDCSHNNDIFYGLNVSSLGGSLTKVKSLTVSNFTRNLLRSIWHRIALCHLTFCRTSYETEDPFVVKVVFVSNRICLAQNFVLAKH